MSPRLRWKLNQLQKTIEEYKEKFGELFKVASAKQKICPSCRALLSPSETRCPFCDASLSVFNRVGVQRVAGSVLPEMNYSWTLIAINFLVFGVELLAATKAGEQFGGILGIPPLIVGQLGSNFGPLVIQGHYWRLLSYAFLHGNLIHLLFNMLWLISIGPMLEETYGSSRFIFMYVLTAIGGGLVSHFSRYGYNNSVGASGAIFGLIGIMIAYGFRNRTAAGERIRSTAIRWAISGLVFGFMMHADNAAHIGGALTGLALGYLMNDGPLVRRESIVMWQVLNYASWLAILASVVLVALNPVNFG